MPFDTKPIHPSTGPHAPPGTERVIGYYRFTDIFFEWHQALPNQEDVSPLKATISHNALVHPDHPLRKPGVNGIELYRGTFASGEMRLLFSSAQVEYLRYWLHAMRLTKEPIPIPSSDYLILQTDLEQCSPDVYNDAMTLKRAIKVIEKNNKRLKGADSILALRRLTFERVRTLWAAKLGTWCAMDFEAWDRDHTLLTEFGWKTMRWVEGEPVSEHGHLVVQERRKYLQHYVPNHREFYNFGKSEDVNKDQFQQRICEMIDEHRASGPLFLVFHDHSQDIKYLKSEAIKALDRTEILSDAPQKGEVYVVDTAELFSALEGVSGGNMRSLESVCRLLRIQTKYLHNAGNDAYYTLDAMVAMASGDPVDQQREQRWPNRTQEHKPEVKFQDWEEDSDFSDMEGIFGPGQAGQQPEADDNDVDL